MGWGWDTIEARIRVGIRVWAVDGARVKVRVRIVAKVSQGTCGDLRGLRLKLGFKFFIIQKGGY